MEVRGTTELPTAEKMALVLQYY